MIDRPFVTVVVLNEWPDRWKVNAFLEIINGAVAKIPPEWRDVAVVDLDGGLDESTSLSISYTRPKTDAEVAAAAETRARAVQAEQDRQREEYLRLKAKFEPAS